MVMCSSDMLVSFPPLQELMSQASWNLCPVSIAYNSDCYYDKDQTFSSIQGEVHVSITDAPDGQWDLQVSGGSCAV